jgi:antitoxin component YwqK of YwqJK toxin-antitoxin module
MKQNIELLIDDSCQLKYIYSRPECDLLDIHECLYGEWKVYYPNGQLKETGSMDTIVIEQPCYERPPWLEDPYDLSSYNKLPLKLYQSVRNGEWKFYDSTGKLTGSYHYQKGKLIR